MNPIVSISEGKLLGKVCKTINEIEFHTFRGIPYAKPPVDELRFAAPQQPEPWEGIRDATKDCNICAQFDRETLQVVGDEDCLYLNVYTPCLPYSDTLLMPVMVFFHGGGFVHGNGTDDSVHGPDYLIEKNVVIVSLNYRLGILGFLSLDCKEAPGNMGLKDQVQALKWVQKNIRSFNGDPDNVTIFGISAGGASVEYLLLSPMAKGLFHKAIAQSGSSLLPWAQNNRIRELAAMIPAMKKKVVTDNQDLLKFLKTMSKNDLISTSMMVLAADKWKGGLHFGFVPAIEKQGDWEIFFSKSTYKLLAEGEFNKVPFMTGFCTREGLIVIPFRDVFERVEKEKNFIEFLPFNLSDAQKKIYEDKIEAVYLDGESVYKDKDTFAIDFFTDVDFLGGIYVATSLIAKNNSPVYFYEFAYDGNLNYLKKKLNIDREGACHGDDGGYIVKSDLLKGNLSDTDKLVRDRMCQLWTNFAKYGAWFMLQLHLRTKDFKLNSSWFNNILYIRSSCMDRVRNRTLASTVHATGPKYRQIKIILWNPTPKLDNLITTKWEPIAGTEISCLLIDDKLTMKNNIYPERIKLFTELFEKYY